MSLIDVASAALVVTGLFFFVAGTFGLLRFPDVYTRLHAITKADNVGLGFFVVGLGVGATDWREVVALLLIWLFVVLASTTSAHLIAGAAKSAGIEPWKEEG